MPYRRCNAPLLSWLHRISNNSSRTNINYSSPISNPGLPPHRYVQLPASHGVHRESQLFHEFQAYVFPHVASCRNPTTFPLLALLAHIHGRAAPLTDTPTHPTHVSPLLASTFILPTSCRVPALLLYMKRCYKKLTIVV